MKILNRKIEELNFFQIILLIIYVAVILLIAIKLPVYLYNKDYEKRKGYSKEFSVVINTLREKEENIEKFCDFISTSNNEDIKLITNKIKNEYCLNNNISLNQKEVYEKLIEDLEKKDTLLILKNIFKTLFYFSLFIFIISLGFGIFSVAFIFSLLIAIGFPFMITFLNIIIGS